MPSRGIPAFYKEHSLGVKTRTHLSKRWTNCGETMKQLAILLSASAFASCSGLGDFSVGGLSYDLESDSFSGLPLTELTAMPVTGTATYSGKYRGGSFQNLFAGGSATMGVNFSANTVALTLDGDFVGTSQGRIFGTTVRSNRGTGEFAFDGDFYGDDGGVIAGSFEGLTSRSNPTSVAAGDYIVAR